MVKTNNKSFNQQQYVAEWSKKNMGRITAQYKKAFVNQFKSACKKLGITQSEVIRKAMEETIKKAEKL